MNLWNKLKDKILDKSWRVLGTDMSIVISVDDLQAILEKEEVREHGWIPCSHRLPSPHQVVMVA